MGGWSGVSNGPPTASGLRDPMARRGSGEGTIYQRSDGRWEGKVDAGWSGGQRLRKSIYGRTRKEVADKLLAVLREQRDGRLVVGRAPTVGQYLGEWLRVVEPSVRAKTYTSYEGTVRLHISPSLGRLRLDKLTPVHVHDWLRGKAATGLSPRSVQYILHVLRIALGKAERWGLVTRNAAALVDGPRVPRRPASVLNPDEARRFLEAARGHRLGALYTVALSLGLRQGEALGLRWSDVDLDKRVLRVQGALQRVPGAGLALVEAKTATSNRVVVLPTVCVDVLRDQRVRQVQDRLVAGSRWEETGLVFTSGVGTGLDGGMVTKSLQRLLVDSDLPRLRFHDLRHSAASLLMAQGVPPRVVMEVLGHSRFGMTMDVYTHVFPALLEGAADAMDRTLGRQAGRQESASDGV